MQEPAKRIAIIGGGPSGLFLYKQLSATATANSTIDIYEAKNRLGQGMPYSCEGANREHVTNVSGNEIPQLVTPLVEWLQTLPSSTLLQYNLDKKNLTDYKVVPRLLFGEYLHAQFLLLKEQAEAKGIITNIYLECRVTDLVDLPAEGKVAVKVNDEVAGIYDHAGICTGHNWPITFEGKVKGYFDSPYPPSKLLSQFNHPVALRGSSLTAIDAIRTLARMHGHFVEEAPHRLSFRPAEEAKDFKIVMHSKQGLLPGIRFHLEDPHLSKEELLSKEDIAQHIKENDGFLSLDFIFEKDFKDAFKEKQPFLHALIKDMRMETFIDAMMGLREAADPFELFRAEYEEAAQSIRRKESVYWKEMLAVLSFAMNYPAKYFSAEDMLRLQKKLMPLISLVIAFVPQGSCEELMALHAAGRLELIAVGDDSHIETVPTGGIVYHYSDEAGETKATAYKTFVDCIGQRHLSIDDFPFKSLVKDGIVTAATLPFRSAEAGREKQKENNENIKEEADGTYYLKVPGIAITDSFRVVSSNGKSNPRIYVMAVPYIGGYNPDYSGLDFCEEASGLIAKDILQEKTEKQYSIT